MADLLEGVKEAIINEAKNEEGDSNNFKMPTTEELLAALDKISGLDEQSKEELRKSLTDGQAAFGARGGEGGPVNMGMAAHNNTFGEFLILFGFITLIFLILVFFGYKLYHSLVERERKREEKKKQKLQKKKK